MTSHGQADAIMLPQRGQVFRVLGSLFNDRHPDRMRPAVVVWSPATVDAGVIQIVTRTSDPTYPRGIPSPKDTQLGLDRPGVWGYPRNIDPVAWSEPDIEFLGRLVPGVVDQICTYFKIPESPR